MHWRFVSEGEIRHALCLVEVHLSSSLCIALNCIGYTVIAIVVTLHSRCRCGASVHSIKNITKAFSALVPCPSGVSTLSEVSTERVQVALLERSAVLGTGCERQEGRNASSSERHPTQLTVLLACDVTLGYRRRGRHVADGAELRCKCEDPLEHAICASQKGFSAKISLEKIAHFRSKPRSLYRDCTKLQATFLFGVASDA